MRDLDETINVESEVVDEVNVEVNYEHILKNLKIIGCYALLGFVSYKWGYFKGKKDALVDYEQALRGLFKELEGGRF